MRSSDNCAVALLLMVAAGCTSGAEWQGTVSDSAGITIVSNTEQGLWADDMAWTVEEDLRIGVQQGDPEYMFGQIGWLAVGGDGSIFVLDAQAQHIKRYTPDGTYVNTFAGPGGGPGELGQGAVFMLVGPGDTLIVPDVQNQRINRYTGDGESIGSTPLSFADGLPLAWRGNAVGVVAKQVRPLDLPNRPATDSMDAILALAGDGTVRDTLLRLPSGGTLSFGGASPEIKLYSPEPIWTITDELDLLYGMNDDYRIGRYRGGELTSVFTMPFTRRAVTDDDQEAMISFLEDAWRDAGLPPAAIQQARGIISFGDWIPAFANLQMGPAETLWVQHIQSVSDLSEEQRESFNLLEDSGAPEWDVFDADGRYLGVVTMPPRFAPRMFLGDNVYGVWRDELDAQYVVRLRIVSGAG